MSIAYLGLGSNQDHPIQQILNAIEALSRNESIGILTVSSLYLSHAVDGSRQAPFVNAAVKIKTNHPPLTLLSICKTIEQTQDRTHYYRWGPRTIDLDILLYDDLVLETTKLTIPHPEIPNRDFVVYPLLELDPKLNHPVLGPAKNLNPPRCIVRKLDNPAAIPKILIAK